MAERSAHDTTVQGRIRAWARFSRRVSRGEQLVVITGAAEPTGAAETKSIVFPSAEAESVLASCVSPAWWPQPTRETESSCTESIDKPCSKPLENTDIPHEPLQVITCAPLAFTTTCALWILHRAVFPRPQPRARSRERSSKDASWNDALQRSTPIHRCDIQTSSGAVVRVHHHVSAYAWCTRRSPSSPRKSFRGFHRPYSNLNTRVCLCF